MNGSNMKWKNSEALVLINYSKVYLHSFILLLKKHDVGTLNYTIHNIKKNMIQ